MGHARTRRHAGQLVSVRQVAYGPEGHRHQLGMVTTYDGSSSAAVSRRVLGEAGALIAALCVLAIGVGAWLSRAALRPLTDLVSAVRSLDLEAGPSELPVATPEAQELAQVLSATLARLQERTAELAANNQELEQFAYIAAHDLQEPVRTISSFVALLEKQDTSGLSAQSKASLKFITESCARMRELIQGLLAYGRLGKQASPEPVSLSELVGDVLGDLNAALRDRGGTVCVGELPRLVGLRSELRALLQNLLQNAIKFSRPEVPPRVELSGSASAGGVELLVDDNGIGIAPEHRERVFRLFQRLHARGDYAGTGIGLAHCNKIAQLHHGRITVEDSPLGGARFRVVLRDLKRPPEVP